MPKPLSADTATGSILHQWSVTEFTRYDRSRSWYAFMISVAAVLIVYGMWSNNFLFALIIILAGIILFLQEQREPIDVDFAISELGVVIGRRFYPYEELEHFFIVYRPPEVQTLFFETKNMLHPRVRVPLDDRNPIDIRHTLQAFLPEDTDRTEEPMSDMIARRWRLM
jgi:hypothetical protein